MLLNNLLRKVLPVVILLVWPSATLAIPATDLIEALRSGDTGLATGMLRQGVDLHARTASGATPLHAAAAYGYAAIVRLLLAEGAKAGEVGPNGNTALIYAAQEGHAEVVRVLLRAGADPQARNDFGATAVGLARGRGHREVTADLSAVAATPATDSSGRSWVQAAVLLSLVAAVVVLFKTCRTYFGWRSSQAQ